MDIAEDEKQLRLEYNQAISLTVNEDPRSPPLSTPRRWITWCGGSCGLFQVIFLVMLSIISNAPDPIFFMVGFLTVAPKEFECNNNAEGTWQTCTKEEICDQGLQPEQYRPNKDDPEYIDNWTSPEKMNLLCEPKSKIGLQGSLYFVGLCTTILPVPLLADKPVGRKWMVFIGNVLLIIAMVGLLFTHNIYESYVFFFITGMSFSGR